MIKLIPLFPLVGFLINGLFGKKLGKTAVGAIGTLAVFTSFALSVNAFMQLNGGVPQITENVFTWLNVGGLKLDFAFLVDHLSVWMMLIITGIGTLIHLYSIGYMHEDEGFHKFFAYLNLFVFSMLLLVMGSNYMILFFGWEGVGLCSYLLIGFWFTNTDYANAARKAFIMNRIGDLGLLLGMFLIFQQYGSLDFATVFGKAGSAGVATITTITLLLFVGAMGKSAQIPLYTWLPDAMAGPTPVSALIHAATMVTAGIYMMVRSNSLFSLAPFTMEVVTYVGLATSIFAALIGLKQNDIKKVLAYSTVSQLGLMFVAAGVGAYSSAMFHLTTHAFFKALLFLGAGSVIHGLHHEQDIRKMGGLRSKMPITFWTFTIGTLAIIGMPPFSGFVSKDEMLAGIYAHSPILWFLTLFSAGITIFYMLRMYYLTFFGDYRGTSEQAHHIHESPLTMTLPLMVLAFFSFAGGFINLPAVFFHEMQWFSAWLKPILTATSHHALSHATEYMLMGITTVLVIVGLWFVHRWYIGRNHVPANDADVSGFKNILANKFYIDELYDAVFVRPIEVISGIFHKILDVQIIDGVVNSVSTVVATTSNAVRRIQTGNIEFYLFCMVGGIILILALNFLI